MHMSCMIYTYIYVHKYMYMYIWIHDCRMMPMHQKPKKKMIQEMCVCLCVSSVCRIVLAIPLSHHKRFSSRWKPRGLLAFNGKKSIACLKSVSLQLPVLQPLALKHPVKKKLETSWNIFILCLCLPQEIYNNLNQPAQGTAILTHAFLEPPSRDSTIHRWRRPLNRRPGAAGLPLDQAVMVHQCIPWIRDPEGWHEPWTPGWVHRDPKNIGLWKKSLYNITG